MDTYEARMDIFNLIRIVYRVKEITHGLFALTISIDGSDIYLNNVDDISDSVPVASIDLQSYYLTSYSTPISEILIIELDRLMNRISIKDQSQIDELRCVKAALIGRM